jgi:hypothetical protein
MRMITLSVAVSLAVVSSAALAQQTTGAIGSGSPPAATAATAAPPVTPLSAGAAPEAGGPLMSRPGPGLNKVADDGVSTKTVRAVRCSTAARETDGTTTCVGIPERGAKARSAGSRD